MSLVSDLIEITDVLTPSTPLAMLALRAARDSAPLRGCPRGQGFDFHSARQSTYRQIGSEG